MAAVRPGVHVRTPTPSVVFSQQPSSVSGKSNVSLAELWNEAVPYISKALPWIALLLLVLLIAQRARRLWIRTTLKLKQQ